MVGEGGVLHDKAYLQESSHEDGRCESNKARYTKLQGTP